MSRSSRRLCAIIAVFNILIPSIVHTQQPQLGVGVLSRQLKISSREASLIYILESHASNVDAEKFTKDPVLVQEHTPTKYVYPNSKIRPNNVIFRKKNPDVGKDAIILSSADNGFAIPTPRGAKKRQFVLLRKSPNYAASGGSIPYHASFIFVRNLLPNDTNQDIFKVSGVDSVAEYDIWEQRTHKFYAGWTNCDFTVMVSCASVKAIIEELTKHAQETKQQENDDDDEENDNNLDSSNITDTPVDLIPIISEPGFDPGDYNDLYLDFDVHRFVLEEDESTAGDPKPEKRKGRKKRWASSSGARKQDDSNVGAGAQANVNVGVQGRVRAGFGPFGIFGGGRNRGGGLFGGLMGTVGNVVGQVGNLAGSVVNTGLQAGTGILGGATSSLGGILGSDFDPLKLVSGVLGGGDGGLEGDSDLSKLLGGLGLGGKGGLNISLGAGGILDFNSFLKGGAGGGSKCAKCKGGAAGGGGGLGGLFGIGEILSGVGSGIEGTLGAGLGLGGILGGGGGGGGLLTGVLGGGSGGGGILDGILGGGGGGGGLLGGILGGGGGVGGLGGMAGGMVGGLGGNVLGNLANSVLSPLAGTATGLVGQAGELVGGLTGNVAGGLSNLAGGAGDILGGLTGGANGPLAGLLGPAGNLLQPLTGTLEGVKNLAQDLPGIGLGIGKELVGTVKGVADAAGIGDLIQQAGLGGVIDTVTKSADSIISTGEKLLSTWDTIGNEIIETAAVVLTKAGLPPEVALLASLGGQLAFSAASLVPKGFALGWRIGVDTAGSALNGGRYKGKGFNGPDSVISNDNLIFGTLLPGAENGKKFFLPQGALVQAVFKCESAKISGFFEPSSPGSADAFYPDDDKLATSCIGKRGRVLPTAYKVEDAKSDPGIIGVLSEGNLFTMEGSKMRSVYDPSEPMWKDKIWIHADTLKKTPKRPSATPDGKKILYGYLFYGVIQSPDVFVAEGDSLSGFFVPDDKGNPQITEPVHGVLTPAHPAGHAIFVADSMKDAQFLKELRGVFAPDALDLAGGISGALWKSDSQNEFSFVADRPATDFVFIPQSPQVANVWCIYYGPGEFKYSPPALSKEEEDAAAEPEVPAPKPASSSGLLGTGLLGKPMEVLGLKIVTKKSTLFIPQGYTISGAVIPVDMKKAYQPMLGELTLSKPDEPGKITITKKPDGAPNVEGTVVCLFVPLKFPEGDAIAGHFTMDDAKTGKLNFIQTKQSHLWKPEQEIWIPVGFKEKQDKDEKAAAAAAAKAAEEEAKADSSSGGAKRVPGVIQQSPRAPRRLSNYKFGWKFEGTDDMQSNVIDKLPHEYHYGKYVKDPASSEPIFAPFTGVKGQFKPDSGSPVTVFYFPQRNEKVKCVSITADGRAIAAGTMGKFYTLDEDGKPSQGYVMVKADGDGLTPVSKDVEIMDGWAQTKELDPKELPKGYESKVSAEYLKPPRRRLKYALTDVGGGFKGVAVEGAESLDDPNNPLFQEFLHYRAQQYGDVNPWGLVSIIEPLERIVQAGVDATAAVDPLGGIFGGIFQLGMGVFQQVTSVATSMASSVVGTFSVSNWQFPILSELDSTIKKATGGQVTLSPLRLGGKMNVASLLDFRMFLLHKYDAVRAEIDGKWTRIFVPTAAEPFLSLKVHAKPKKPWMDAVKKSKETLVIPEVEGVASMFSSLFSVSFGMISSLVRPIGLGVPANFGKQSSSKKSGSWKDMAPYDSWLDESSCDQISLEPFAASQIIGTMQAEVENVVITGMDLGLQLVSTFGIPIPFSRISKKLVGKYGEKREEWKVRDAKSTGPSTTDLLGGLNVQVGTLLSAKKASGGASASASVKAKGRSFGFEAPEEESPHAKILSGWKTQYHKLEDNATLSGEGIIFYGLGNCEQTKLPEESLLGTGDPIQIILYYLAVLRVECMEGAKDRIVNLFNDGFLKLSKDEKYFEIPEENMITSAIRLRPLEMKKLSLAFEFHAFTRTFNYWVTKGFPKTGVMVEPNCVISRSIGFVTEMSFYIISRARKVTPAHSVRMTRNLLATLRTILTKVHQDDLSLTKCQTCEMDKLVTSGDKFRLTCLIQFIIHGLGPYEAGNKLIRPAFLDFINLNKPALKQRVQEFESQFPSKIKLKN